MSRRSIFATVAAMVLAVLAAGCGGGGNGTNSTASLSKAEFIKKADAICSAGEKKLEASFEGFAAEHNLSKKSRPSRAESEEAANTILIPHLEREIKEIRALGAPEGESQQVDELLSTVEAAIEKAKQNPVAFIEQEGKDFFAKANRMAREYGLKVCGQE